MAFTYLFGVVCPRPIKKRGQIFSLYFRITVFLAAFLHVAL